MLGTLLKQSFTKQKKAMALMIVSVAMGTAVTASLMALAMDIKGKVAEELRSFGANITIEPKIEGIAGMAGQKRYLREDDVVKSKTIFWRHNIIGVAPFLDERVMLNAGAGEVEINARGLWLQKSLPIPGEEGSFKAGVSTVSPWWTVEGELHSYDPDTEMPEVLAGVGAAKKHRLEKGRVVTIDGRDFAVSGTVETGGAEDSQIIMDLAALQALKGLDGKVSRVLVSALTTPMDEFAYRDPSSMSEPEYEKWYCTGYVTSIAKQLEEAFQGSRAKPIWNVAEAEGRVLERMSLLIYILSAASLAAAALGVSTTMIASLLRRLDEIALMKSIGADSLGIIGIFIAEAAIIGIAGGVAGYVFSVWIAKFIGLKVFGVALTRRLALFPLSLLSALLIAALGSFIPIRRALRVKPAIVLKGA